VLPVLLSSFLCRADDLRINVGATPDSGVVRRGRAPRLMSLEVLGRPIVIRFAPPLNKPAKRDSASVDSIVSVLQRVGAQSSTSASSLDSSPRLSAPSVCRGAGPVRIDYIVGQWSTASRLEIFDLAGRRVASLPIAAAPQGRGVAWWQPVSGPGVYFLRLVRPDAVLTRRIVRLS